MRPITLIGLLVLTFFAVSSVVADSAPTAQPAFAAVPTARPVFLQAASSLAMAPLPPAAPRLGQTFFTSVLPPGPPNGAGQEQCSVEPIGTQGSCSALAVDEVCSAYLYRDIWCSSHGATGNVCSAHATDSTCSVVPPIDPENGNAFCSAIVLAHGPTTCSAVGTAANQRCSIKGPFSQQNGCSTLPLSLSNRCSVINVGATSNSFCSTKAGQAILAELCSALSGAGSCSVILGGKGKCTSFGMADPMSCSTAISGNGHCSVIGGAAGNPCVQ